MFWGLTIEPGKHYTQTVEESFHVSMAALETRDHVAESGGEKTGIVQVLIKHEKTEFLVCSLFYGTVFQQPVDLNFTEGEEVTFFTEGRGMVHLTGYLVKEEPLDIDQDIMSLEDASSSDDVSVSSEGMASGEESPRPEIANKPCKRKKKRARWKRNDALIDRHSAKRCRSSYQRKRRKMERVSDKLNPQRLPRGSGDVKLVGEKDNSHTRGWTMTVVGSVRSKTAHADKSVNKECLGQVTDTVVSTGVSSILSKDDTHVKRTTDRNPLPVESLEKLQRDQRIKSSVDKNPSRKQGEKGTVLQEKLSRLSPTIVPKAPEQRNSDLPLQTSARCASSGQSGKFVQTQESVNSPLQHAKNVPTSSSTQIVNVNKPSNSVTKRPENHSHHRTIDKQPLSRQRHSPTGGMKQNKPGPSEIKVEDDQVLIEEIKIEDDSTEEDPHRSSFYIAESPSQPPSSSPVSTTGQTLPLITSVTSIRRQQQMIVNQPLMANPLLAMSHQFQDQPGAWNMPGPSREQPGVQLEHGNNMADTFMTSHHDRMAQQQALPVALSRHNDPMGGMMEASNLDDGDEGEMILSDEVLRAMPVATEIRDLTPADMTVNGIDISQEQIILARGYNVFLTRGQLYEVQKASRETSKTPWSVCVRRLMDIYFDRQTLAMGKATSHGFSNNPDRKALNQEVIQAIKEYIATKYAIAERLIFRTMTVYCSDTRRTAEGRRKKDSPDDADIGLQQLANEELSDDYSEEEKEWSPKSGSKKLRKKKAKRDVEEVGVQQAESPSQRKRRNSSGDAGWMTFEQLPQRKSAKKARRSMAMAIAATDDADQPSHQLANKDEKEDKEDEDWCDEHVSQKTPNKKTMKVAGTPSKQRRRGSKVDADLKAWEQLPPRESAKKAKRTMAIAMATKHGLDLDEDSDTDEGDEGRNEKINRPGEDVLISPGVQRRQTRSRDNKTDSETLRGSTDDRMITNIDDEDDRENASPKTRQNKKKERNKDNNDDIEIVAEVGADTIFDDDDDDDDYVPDDNVVLVSDSGSSTDKDEFEENKDTDEEDEDTTDEEDLSDNEGNERDEEEGSEGDEEEGSEDNDEEDEEESTKKGVPNGHTPRQKQKAKEMRTVRMEKEKEDSKTVRGVRRNLSDKENVSSPGGKQKEAQQVKDSGKKEKKKEKENSKTTQDVKGNSPNKQKVSTSLGKQKDAQQVKESGKKDKKKRKEDSEVVKDNLSNQETVFTPGDRQRGAQRVKDSGKKEQKKGKEDSEVVKDNLSNQETAFTPGGRQRGAQRVKDSGKKEQKKKLPTPMTLKGGVLVREQVEGDGRVAKSGRMVQVYYKGRLDSNNKQFDACVSGKPFAFRLGSGEVIPGWDTGIAGMKVGGKRQITIPSGQGYGAKKVGSIPSHSKLIFDVELKSVK